jgi:NADH dehydrogenase FAD-containing subunit
MGQTPHVLVVGGSFAGLQMASSLRNIARVSLLEPRDYFEYTPGILHVLCGQGLDTYRKISGPLSSFLSGSPSIFHIQGSLFALNALEKVAYARSPTASGETIISLPYDILILCTGSPYISPIHASALSTSYIERTQEILSFQTSVRAASSVLIAGGGLVGVELAAELAYHFLDKTDRKSVMMITRSGLLDNLPSRAGDGARAWLQEHGVQVMEQDEVISSSRSNSHNPMLCVQTKRGCELTVSLLIDCTGHHPPTPEETQTARRSLLHKHLQGKTEGVTEYPPPGGLIVDEYFRVNPLNGFSLFLSSPFILILNIAFKSV